MKIFVSYSRRDAGDFAEQIRESLIDEHEVFTDVNNIQLGDVWSNIIEENISTCDIFVVIVTYRALQSPHVESEILQAQRENKKIIPCFHKSVTNGYIKWGLDKIQGIEFTNEYQLARDLHYKIAYHDSSNKNRGRIFETTPKTAETNKISPPKLRIDLKVIISIMAIAVIVSIIIVIMFFPFNNLPIANAGSNQAVDSRDIVILNGNKSRDSDGNIVSYSWNQIDEGPKVALNNPYTSNPSFRAPIVTSDTKLTFTLTVKDNKGNNSTNFASVDITVKAVNDPPIANNQTIITTINKPVNITLTAYDPQRNDTVTAQIVSQPSNGSLSEINQETGLIIYTPNSSFTGTDKFTYKVNDGKVDSKNVGTITITVTPINYPPKANNQSYTTIESKATNIILTAHDEDANDTVTAQIVSQPSNGSLSEINQETGLIIYTPNSSFTGTDKFTYKVNDGKVDSKNVGTITITVK